MCRLTSFTDDPELQADVDRLLSLTNLSITQLRKSKFGELYAALGKEVNATCAKHILYHVSCPIIPQCGCGKSLKWNVKTNQYRKFCSSRCSNQSSTTKQIRKEALMTKYTVDHISKIESVKHKKKQSSMVKYGVENPFQATEIQQKIKETNLERYGVEYATQSDSIQQKIKETNLERYGVTCSLQNPEKIKLRQATMMNKYGVEHPYQSEIIRDRGKKTSLAKYSVEYYSQTNEYKEKYKQTCNRIYGVEYPSQIHFTETAKNLLMDEQKFIEIASTIPIIDISSHYKIPVTSLMRKIQKLQITPIGIDYNKSWLELQVLSYIKSISDEEIVVGKRQTIKPLELDIYIPGKKLAIECNGTYWHSENQNRGKYYHLDKTNKCNESNIRLFHIWDFQWKTKSNIVKSMLLNALGKSKSIFARKCTVCVLTTDEARAFIDANHIQGHANAQVYLGLKTNDCLVAVMTFTKSRYNKNYQWELLRYANILNTRVVGGASKLLNYFTKNYSPTSIISYSDKSRGTGNMYAKLNLTHHTTTKPSYRYTLDYKTFFNRVKFQKHKLSDILPHYDPALTEWENMKNNGYDRVWDCGTDVWIWEN